MRKVKTGPLLLTLLISLICINLHAYEVDQFTRRNEVPKDSTEILDKEINARIVKAVAAANKGVLGTNLSRDRCDSPNKQERYQSRLKLFGQLRDQLKTDDPIGVLEDYAAKNKQIDKRKVTADDSIYAEAKNKYVILKTFGITSVINVNGTQIGLDKLGHFFSQGYEIYLRNAKRESYTDRAKIGMLDSISSEKSYYGLGTTGVKSYADMAANYDGQRFWEKLCGFPKQDSTSPTICEKDAMLSCEKGNWVIKPDQSFTLKDYVTPGWDESINCSSYDPSVSASIFTAMSQRVYTYKGNPKQPCPAEPEKCVGIVESYRKNAKGVINPICKKIARAIKDNKKTDPSVRYDYSFHLYEEDNQASPQELKTNSSSQGVNKKN